MKLHLGCGPVYLKGYLNCDLKGLPAKDYPELVEENITTVDNYFKAPFEKKLLGVNKKNKIVIDMKVDMRKIPFKENSVEEILLVNVVDHIRFQEIPDCFDEWHRVLQPGGKLIIDVNEIRGSCEALLAAKTRKEFEWANRLIFCHARDENDSHHWGYTPEYLRELLEEHKFTHVWTKKTFIKHAYPALQICVKK
jgi:ubiquinone/menaquinone biosynthesis C-methylase UbiE